MPDMIGNARDAWPVFGLTDDIRPALSDTLAAGEPCVLATLFAADGGAPRGIGAQMLITADAVHGYVSGGCVEADIAIEARRSLADGEPRRLVYGRGGPVDIMLPCGGRIELLLEQLAPGDPAAAKLLDLSARRHPALWVSDGRTRACVALGEHFAVQAATGTISRPYEPRSRVVLFGGDPVAIALAGMMQPAGHEIFFVRPKGPDAAPPVPAHYLRGEPQAALEEIAPDPWTSIVVASHDEIHDHQALMAALASPAGYVGLLGSRRRLSGKLERLRAQGMREDAVARLHAPIGLEGFGRGAWEVAASIQGEILRALEARKLSVGDFEAGAVAVA